jgi:hypothetical protein
VRRVRFGPGVRSRAPREEIVIGLLACDLHRHMRTFSTLGLAAAMGLLGCSTTEDTVGPVDDGDRCIVACDADEGAGDTEPEVDDGSTGSASGDPSTGEGDPTDATEGDASSSGGDEPPGASFGWGSAFDDVQQMLDYLNEQRQGYLPHDRWRGLPWTGQSHQMVTWPVAFAWDDELAVLAQLEADALASGAPPEGSPATADTLNMPPLYVRGVNSDHYVVLGPELPNSWGVSNNSTLGREHGSARQALYYHDPGGAGPVLAHVGIGASDAGDGSTWWVLVFE